MHPPLAMQTEEIKVAKQLTACVDFRISQGRVRIYDAQVKLTYFALCIGMFQINCTKFN